MDNNFSQHVFDVANADFQCCSVSFSMLQTLILNVAWTVRWKIFPSDVLALASPFLKMKKEFRGIHQSFGDKAMRTGYVGTSAKASCSTRLAEKAYSGARYLIR